MFPRGFDAAVLVRPSCGNSCRMHSDGSANCCVARMTLLHRCSTKPSGLSPSLRWNTARTGGRWWNEHRSSMQTGSAKRRPGLATGAAILTFTTRLDSVDGRVELVAEVAAVHDLEH